MAFGPKHFAVITLLLLGAVMLNVQLTTHQEDALDATIREMNAVLAQLPPTANPMAVLMRKTRPETFTNTVVVTYLVIARNMSAQTITNVTVAFPIPADLTFVTTGSSPECIQTAQTVLCNPLDYAPGKARSYIVNFSVSATASCGAEISVQALVSGDGMDPLPTTQVRNIVACPSGEAASSAQSSVTSSQAYSCIAEGALGTINANSYRPICCAGLNPISAATPQGQEGCTSRVGSFVCAKCGDGTCGDGENQCNCSQDCGQMVPTCIAEGQRGSYLRTPPDTCCTGLTATPNAVQTGNGQCIATNDGGFVCVKCGDGVCGTGETRCNCSHDCSATSSQSSARSSASSRRSSTSSCWTINCLAPPPDCHYENPQTVNGCQINCGTIVCSSSSRSSSTPTAACGNGSVEANEGCGEPGAPNCEAGYVCQQCRCVATTPLNTPTGGQSPGSITAFVTRTSTITPTAGARLRYSVIVANTSTQVPRTITVTLPIPRGFTLYTQESSAVCRQPTGTQTVVCSPRDYTVSSGRTYFINFNVTSAACDSQASVQATATADGFAPVQSNTITEQVQCSTSLLERFAAWVRGR